VIQEQSTAQQRAQAAQATQQANQTALANSLVDLYTSMTSSKPKSAPPAETSPAVQQYETEQAAAQKLHEKVQAIQDKENKIISTIQNKAWEKVKEQNTNTIRQMDGLAQSIDAIRVDDNPWSSPGARPTPSGSSMGGGGTSNPWVDTPRPRATGTAATAEPSIVSNPPQGTNPWADSTSVAMNDDTYELEKPLAAGTVLYRESATGALRAINRTGVTSQRGDTARSCSLDGVGIVLKSCELKRRQKSPG
jgi:hypothetical protein